MYLPSERTVDNILAYNFRVFFFMCIYAPMCTPFFSQNNALSVIVSRAITLLGEGPPTQAGQVVGMQRCIAG